MSTIKQFSSEYSIPVISIEDMESMSHEEMQSYTHCISLLPYNFSSVSTFSLGIQPLNVFEIAKKPKTKRSKNHYTSFNPLVIDFLPSSFSDIGKRLRLQSGGEMLLKAAGVGKCTDAVIYDLTAGFGQDSLIFASSNNVKKVHMIERDKIVGLLLSDAMRRLKLISTISGVNLSDTDFLLRKRAEELSKKIELHNTDGIDVTSHHMDSSPPDICYLDPMFPPRQKSAAVKKNMQILHALFQSNQMLDEETRLAEEVALLETAMSLAKSRVVVKRPINAPPIGTLKGKMADTSLPSYELKGTINRFDVYIL